MIQESIEDTDCLDYFDTELSIVIIHSVKSNYNLNSSEYAHYDTTYEQYYDFTLNNYTELEKAGLIRIYEIGENSITLQIPRCKSILSELSHMSQKVFIEKMVKLLKLLWSNSLSFNEFKITHIGVTSEGNFIFVNPKFIDYDPIRKRAEYMKDLRRVGIELQAYMSPSTIYDTIYDIMTQELF